MKLLIASSTALILTAAVHGGTPPTITVLPEGFWPSDVSADGTIVVGQLYNSLTVGRWTSANPGVVEDLGGAFTSGNALITEDGTTIYALATGLDGIKRASRWLGGQNWENMVAVPGGSECDAEENSPWGMNGDGSVIVGLGWLPACAAHGYRWDAVNGAVDLGTSSEGYSSRANVVDSSGNIIAGWQDNENGRQGAIWTNGVQALVTNGGFPVGEGMSISPNGNFVSGMFDGASNGAWLNNRQTATTMTLPNVTKDFFATALTAAVSNDGSTVIGCSGGFPFDRTAIIWIDGVPQNLLTYLTDLGTTGLESYFTLGTPVAASDSMTAVVGFAFFGGPPAWVVSFPQGEPCPADIVGDGTVGVPDLLAVINAWGPCGPPCAADLTNDGQVGVPDLLSVINAWGACP